MIPRLTPFRWTRAHLARLPDDGNRYEVLDGALLVTPQARAGHQQIAARLIEFLAQVIPARLDPRADLDWKDFPLPLLVVEILSPGSHRHDQYTKRDAYLKLAIPEYWIVDIDEATIAAYRPGQPEPETHRDRVSWKPRADVRALVVELSELFRA